MRSLFKKLNAPYYIFTPSYDHTSGGNVVMHLLGHALNLSGERAYMVCQTVNEDLYTPRVDNFPASGDFIAIYPEIVEGNPLSAHTVVRYILYYPSRVNTQGSYKKEDIIYTFHKKFWPEAPQMLLPVYSPKECYPGTYKRTITTMYRGRPPYPKLRKESEGSIEINHDYPKTHFEVLELFRKSKIFFTYGFTGMINEAILCGCPVVALCDLEPDEFSTEGIAFSMDQLEYAKRTLPYKQHTLEMLELDFWKQLDIFIRDTQEKYESDYFNRHSIV